MSAKPGGLVVAFTVGCSDAPSFIGEWLGEYDVPTVMLSKADGGEKAWAKHLTREATPDEALAYWKARALKAEAALWSAGYLAPCLLSEGVWFGIHFGHARNYVR